VYQPDVLKADVLHMEHHSAISSLRYAIELRRDRTQFMPVVVKRIAAFVTGYEPVNRECLEGSHPVTIYRFSNITAVKSTEMFRFGKDYHICNIYSCTPPILSAVFSVIINH